MTLTCWDCEREIPEPASGSADNTPRCDSCADEHAQRLYEFVVKNFWGSSSPQTIDEVCAQAWREKEGQS